MGVDGGYDVTLDPGTLAGGGSVNERDSSS